MPSLLSDQLTTDVVLLKTPCCVVAYTVVGVIGSIAIIQGRRPGTSPPPPGLQLFAAVVAAERDRRRCSRSTSHASVGSTATVVTKRFVRSSFWSLQFCPPLFERNTPHRRPGVDAGQESPG